MYPLWATIALDRTKENIPLLSNKSKDNTYSCTQCSVGEKSPTIISLHSSLIIYIACPTGEQLKTKT
jgi:hypothetical protein